MKVIGGSHPVHRGTTGHTASPNHRPVAPVTIHTATAPASGSASCAASARTQPPRVARVADTASTASPGAKPFTMSRPTFL